MITSVALFFLHRALDERRPVPALVRRLSDAHPPTALAVAEVLEVHGVLAGPEAIAFELGQTAAEIPAAAFETASWSQPDPAWWAAGGGLRSVAAVAAVLALAALVAVVTLGSGNQDGSNVAQKDESTPTRIAVQLPALPAVTNPLETPMQAVRTALNPVADPGAALRQGMQRLGEGIEAPLRREWSAIVTQLDAMVRLTDPNPQQAPPTDPPAEAPSTSHQGSPEPIAAVAV
ncbi:MAG: hypothetical protein AAGH92_09350 [Planctomycetota bacterium]